MIRTQNNDRNQIKGNIMIKKYKARKAFDIIEKV